MDTIQVTATIPVDVLALVDAMALAEKRSRSAMIAILLQEATSNRTR